MLTVGVPALDRMTTFLSGVLMQLPLPLSALKLGS